MAELLGLDLLHVACEGTMVLAVPQADVSRALEILRGQQHCGQATCFGAVVPPQVAPVAKQDLFGRLVAVDEPSGAPLPRIC